MTKTKFQVACMMDECHSCPGGEYDEAGDYGENVGDWTPCGCPCHKAKDQSSDCK